MADQRTPWLPRTKLTISLLVLGLFLYLLSRFQVVIAPFVLACILAYVLSPIANFMNSRFRLPRTLAVVIIYILLIAGMVTIPAVAIPPLASQVAGLNLDIQQLLIQIENLFGHEYQLAGQVIDGAALFDQVIGVIQDLVQPIFGETLVFAFDVIESLAWIIFILVVSFYLVKDGQKLRAWLEKLPPAGYRGDFIRLRNEINAIWAAFFRGQLLLALVVATIFTVIGLIIGLPSPLAMGLFAGLMEFLPSVGHGIWLVTASLIALFAGSTWMQVPNWVFVLIIVGLHIVFQQFDLNYLIPRIIGRQVHLPPVVVILGIVAGAAMAGVLGIALAAPTISSSRVIGRYVYANLFDLDPFPEPAAKPLPPPDPRWWHIKKNKRKPGAENEEGEPSD
jgi:predicted PurR-regulated permease PerM